MPRVPDEFLAIKLAIHFGSADLQTMLDRQNLTGAPTAIRALPHGGIGIVGSAWLPAADSLLVFTGVPIRAPALNPREGNATIQRLTALDGAFVAVHWDETASTLSLVTDRLGLQPIYYRHENDGFTVVSDTRALSAEPDLAAWGSFFSLGHAIGDRTLSQGLQRLPPASVIRYQPSDNHLTIDTYWHWPSPSNNWRTFDFGAALVDDANQYAAYAEPTASTLLLSGGLDSRLLLSVLDRAHLDVEALVVTHPGEHRSADSRYAMRAAKAVGMRWRQATATEPFFSSRAYLRYLEAMDAGFPTLDLFIPRVASLLPDRPVWDGLMPDYHFSVHHQPRGGFPEFWRQEVRGPGSKQWQAVGALFREGVAQAMWEGFQDDFACESKRWPQDEFGLARFMFNGRGRNRPGINPLKVYTNWTRVFIPGASAEIVAHAASLPPEVRRGGRFYIELLRRTGRHALAAPLISGGSPVRRSRTDIAYWGTRLHERAFAVLPTRLRRRSQQRSAPSSFIGDWLIDPHDQRWIRPEALNKPATASPSQELVWKVFFYWKAWEWTHNGTLHERLAPRSVDWTTRQSP